MVENMKKLKILIALTIFLPISGAVAEEFDSQTAGKQFEVILQKLTDLGSLAANETNKQVAQGSVSEADKAELLLLNKLSQLAIGQDITCLGIEPSKCPTAQTQKREKVPSK